MKLSALSVAVLGGALLSTPSDDATLVTSERVTAHYVSLALAGYQDSLLHARELSIRVHEFLAEPNEAGFAAVKDAWIDAHQVYSRTEALRFGNPNVDAWEGSVNAWPMDEGLIDYVAEDYVAHEGNPYARANLIARGGATITDELIEALQSGSDPKAFRPSEVDLSDIETNVTRGFHAIEFLLWGQDRNLEPTSSGMRPFTDFLPGEACTGERCDRRRDYLSAATRLLAADLRFATIDWAPDGALYGKDFGELDREEQLDRMIVGLGTMSFGELASERMQVALLTSDQEEEQSCFSDTTHLSILHNALGIEHLYQGARLNAEGELERGPSLSDLVARVAPELDERLRTQLAATRAAAEAIVAAAEAGEPFDRQILADNVDGRARIEVLIECLRKQTESFEAIRTRRADLAAL